MTFPHPLYSVFGSMEIKLMKKDEQFLYAIKIISMQMSHTYTEHNILTDKLYQYWYCSKPHKLIKTYLTSLTQVKVTHPATNQLKEYVLSSLPVRFGVPQCSGFGPLLSILYVNNVPHLTQGRRIMYSDDTTILNIGQDINNFKWP
jgi:hypothetical protein